MQIHFFGIEINREYCLWTIKRLINSLKNPSIQGYFDGVFWERNSLNEQKKTQNDEMLKIKFENDEYGV